LYASSDVTAFKSRRMRWVSHLSHKGKMRNAYNLFVQKLKGRDRLGDLDIGWEVISDE
jgi:hypothetical protein